MRFDPATRWMLWAGALAAVIFTVGELFLEDPALLMNPDADPAAFSQMVTSSGFRVWALRGVFGTALEIIFAIGLYLALRGSPGETLGLWGMLSSIVGDVAGNATFALLAFALPGIGRLVSDLGPQALVAAQGAEPLMAANVAFSLAGLVLFAVAIWRSGVLPRASGIVVLVGFLMIPVQIGWVQLIANLVWGVGALWMALHAWRAPAA